MKTYHQYQSESKQAEQKLRTIQQQMSKMKSAKKQKAMEKRVEKVTNLLGVLRRHADLPVFAETNEIYRNESESIQSTKRLFDDHRIGQCRASEILHG
jgi:ppGpp synthetase/RelA/SpoT-type nucleotidyltranferase